VTAVDARVRKIHLPTPTPTPTQLDGVLDKFRDNSSIHEIMKFQNTSMVPGSLFRCVTPLMSTSLQYKCNEEHIEIFTSSIKVQKVSVRIVLCTFFYHHVFTPAPFSDCHHDSGQTLRYQE